MKKMFAVLMVVMMMLALGATAFAAGGKLTLEQAKQAALDHAGVKASEATFTKAYRDWDDGREVYEIGFYAGNTEYEMDVDALSGRITDFSTEVHAVYGAPAGGFVYGHYDYDDDDRYDYDWDDRYDDDLDDWFDKWFD